MVSADHAASTPFHSSASFGRAMFTYQQPSSDAKRSVKTRPFGTAGARKDTAAEASEMPVSLTVWFGSANGTSQARQSNVSVAPAASVSGPPLTSTASFAIATSVLTTVLPSFTRRPAPSPATSAIAPGPLNVRDSRCASSGMLTATVDVVSAAPCRRTVANAAGASACVRSAGFSACSVQAAADDQSRSPPGSARV